jgi:F0F1-type ATP synthase assembly protein I
MSWIFIKYFITAAVVVLVSELAKRSDKLGGLVAALPLVTILTLIWLYVENQPTSKIANHAWYTFWYVVPTLPMFLVFPVMLPRYGFWPSLLACVFITGGSFAFVCGNCSSLWHRVTLAMPPNKSLKALRSAP